MPFSGPSDPKLPSNVQKLSVAKRRQWVSVWNSSFSRCMAGKLPAAKEDEFEEEAEKQSKRQRCETRAFTIANGVVKELIKMDQDETEGEEETTGEEKARDDDDEIYGNPGPGAVTAVEMVQPLGGATTYSDADSFFDARDREHFIHDQEKVFHILFDNIMRDEEMTLDQKAAAVVAAGQELGRRVGSGPTAQRSLLERVKSLIGLAPVKLGPSHDAVTLPGALTVTKMADGRYHWVTVTTNKFEDREGEIFSEKSHQEYIAYVNKTKDYPELWLYHTPGTRIGRADFVDYTDGFVVHAGTFDPGMEDTARSLEKKVSEIGVSHGFRYIEGDEEDGVYDHYRTLEVTLCPADKAANVWTDFAVQLKEVAMAFEPERREFLVEHLGEERVVQLETNLPALAKELEEHGVSFKMLTDALQTKGKTKREGEEASAEVEVEEVGEVESEIEVESVDDGDPPSTDERIEHLETGLGELKEEMNGVTSGVKAIADSVKELLESDEEKIAKLLSPRRKDTSATRPTESGENEVSDEEAEEAMQGGSKLDDDHPAAKYVEDLIHQGATR